MNEEYTIGLSVTGEGDVASAAALVDSLDDGLDGVMAAASDAARAFDTAAKSAKKLGDTTGKVAEDAAKVAKNYGEIEGAFGKLGGPVGRLGQLGFGTADAFSKLRQNFSGAQVAAIGAASGIGLLVAVAAAAAAAVVALATAAVASTLKIADAANQASVLREALAGSASGAAALTATISSVAQRVPLATSEVAKLAEGLYKAGKRGAELETALLEASYEASGLGKNPGPDLIARRMRGLDVIGSKLKDNIAAIFVGPKTRGATDQFGKALSGLTERFGENKAEGRALQTLLGVLVAPLIQGLTVLIPLGVKVFRGLIIAALDVAIAVVKARNAIANMIPKEASASFTKLVESEEAMKVATDVLVPTLVVLAVAAGVLLAIVLVLAVLLAVSTVVAFLAVALAVAIVVAVFAAIVVAAVAVGKAIAGAVAWLLKMGSSALAAAKGLGASVATGLLTLGAAGLAAAKSLVSGIVSGITSGAGTVAAALKQMAGTAIKAFKDALKISSPSRVFEDLGAYTGEGYTIGVEAETGDVQSALETMTATPQVDAPGTGRRPDAARAIGGGGGAGKAVDLSGATFNFYGVEGAEQAVSRFGEALTAAIEGDAMALGAA